MRDKPTTDWGTVAVSRTKPWLLVLGALLVAVGLTVAATGTVATSPADSEYDQLSVTDYCEDDSNYLTIENPNDETIAVDLAWETDDPSLSIQSDGPISTQIQSVSTADGTEQTLTATVPGDETVAITGLQDGTYNLSASIDKTTVGIYHTNATDDDQTDKTADHTDKTADHTEVTLECGTVDDKTQPIFLTILDDDRDKDDDAKHVDTKHTGETETTTTVETEKTVTDVHLEKEDTVKPAEKDDRDKHDKDRHGDKHDKKHDEKDQHDKKHDEKDRHDDKHDKDRHDDKHDKDRHDDKHGDEKDQHDKKHDDEKGDKGDKDGYE